MFKKGVLSCVIHALLHILVIMRIPSSLKQLVQRHFHSEICHSLNSFCFLGHSMETLKTVMQENPSKSAISEILRPDQQQCHI